ncbi:MAG: aconitate hydratase AcnA [Sphingomonadaceae bacterium]|jgi:aconitate hydratase|uniref:Aconitate hydratase n=4 Tax=Erythrobacteraceae TaxID=335929 RepID=A0A6I4U690_9SPHN|nr:MULTISPECIES: aconitate hydratase AcnA [Erythrobacteraceae]MAL54424.1 aconitate hydratase AcnA [Sphingomonadaceae bacterium]MCZ4264531.1 aconitate hydratase AcnA [Erythrobacter sp. G21629-S1]HCH96262.1 aconitate hydratase AcnA [Erythrobacter sp.]KZY07760.1 aconitate hydratase [Erythrobacter sp. HI0028]MCD1589672.1 aconitate hydratase AcnA [Qipengyuania citrea]|tara:strand:+ start:150 stop:2825 length:2676 start_codon:yes stop_codon:yes gene_type:complete
MTQVGKDTLGTRSTLTVNGKDYAYYSFAKAAEKLGDVSKLPFSLKVLLENMLRFEDGGFTVSTDDAQAIVDWQKNPATGKEIQYRPARVLLQDFTGVPCVVDLAAMRDAISKLGGDTAKINPQVPVNLVIDHSVMVDEFGHPKAFEKNVELEYARNAERYDFLKWGSKSFENFSAVPPGTGICHQVNLEYIGKGVWSTNDPEGEAVAYPDTCVGTDSHTTMINGLGVLGWGVGGIEAEAAMLGQPISMLIPEVVGFKLTGAMAEGVTATDLVLTCVQMLREVGVVGRFVEFYGEGVAGLTLADRATIANMAPEYGATCGFFGIDDKTLEYMRLTGRDEETIALVEAYSKEQGMWFTPEAEPVFTKTLELDLSKVVPSLAGPKRPQDRVALPEVDELFNTDLKSIYGKDKPLRVDVEDTHHDVGDGDVVIAAITSCTNTSNPDVLIAAGLVAKKAHEKGLKPKPWVKTSLAPGSQVVTDYLVKSGLQDDLNAMGFDLVGYGCTTCIGNSGPLAPPISKAINGNDIVAASVLSGNRNFEGRVSPDVRANFLASPPLVVAYSILGTVTKDITETPLGQDQQGNDVMLADVWPTNEEIAQHRAANIDRQMFETRYADVYKGDEHWQGIKVEASDTYRWNPTSTYVASPPFFEGMEMTPAPVTDITDAKPLAILGDSVTTDHISPAGSIKEDSPAGSYLQSHQVAKQDFNSYGSRRGNHDVMMRGTFANIRIKNEMVPGVEGGVTTYNGEQMPIYDAAMKHKEDGTPLVVVAGKEYGTGSSRDWAAKGTILLGVKAVIVESYERIHRSNLIGMGVLPLQFKDGDTRNSLGLTGSDSFTIKGLADLSPSQDVEVEVTREDGSTFSFTALCRIDTANEMEYYRNGGILHYVLRKLAAA